MKYDLNSNGMLALDDQIGLHDRMNLEASEDLLPALILKMDINNIDKIKSKEL